jgi:hypothetical protein
MLHRKQTISIASSCFVFVSSYESLISNGNSRLYRWALDKHINPQIRNFLGSVRYRKSANFLVAPGLRQSANGKSTIFMIIPQIENPQISTKHRTTLSQNSRKSRLCKRIFNAQIWIRASLYGICYIWKEKKYVFAVLRKFYVRKSPKRFWVRQS